jgi:hypothetical protein
MRFVALRHRMGVGDWAFALGILGLTAIQIAEPLWLWCVGWWAR